jgi:hypothetical protein
VDDLCTDLLDWETLYVSGRMHKPVAMMQSDARVRLAQQVNLTSALRVALLLLPERFTEVELYTRIASLSYVGDFRMRVPGGENADKVRNIVLGQREQFRRLYAGLLRSLGTVQIVERRTDRYAMTVSLPSSFLIAWLRIRSSFLLGLLARHIHLDARLVRRQAAATSAFQAASALHLPSRLRRRVSRPVPLFALRQCRASTGRAGGQAGSGGDGQVLEGGRGADGLRQCPAGQDRRDGQRPGVGAEH